MRCLLAVLFCWLAPVHALAAPGVIVAAGGGPEGEIGDESAWSYSLYKKLVENGDVNHDGRIQVAVLSSEAPPTDFMVRYFRWLGATEARNVIVGSRDEANDPASAEYVAHSDIVFIRGGDQGDYYHFWSGTKLSAAIAHVAEIGGAIGGTSAGAMSLSQYCLSGRQDLVSLDVLQDALSPYLEDTEGGSSIHTDFLNLVPHAIIDTHFGERGRLGRLLGVHGKAVQDSGDPTILGIGIGERTGLVIRGKTARVYGIGAVEFLRQTERTRLSRERGHPLFYTDLRDDILTEGWTYDLEAQLPSLDQLPTGASEVLHAVSTASASGALTLRGDSREDQALYARAVQYDPAPYATVESSAPVHLNQVIGLNDAESPDHRGAIAAAMNRALYDFPDATGILLPAQAEIRTEANAPDRLEFERNASQTDAEAAALVLDCSACTHKGLSPYVSNSDTGSGTLHSAALVNLRVHVLAESAAHAMAYDTRSHRVTR